VTQSPPPPAAVPYAAQWESPGLIRAILSGDLAARDDPRWACSGADDPEQYEFWSWRCCGMACLRSVLLARSGQAPGNVTLGLEVLATGGYRLRYDSDGSGRPEGLDGLIYAPFVTYLAERWQIQATVHTDLSTAGLVDRVARGQWVMASVHPSIRRPAGVPPSRGGHLVLVHGVARSPGRATTDVVLHNPSGHTAAAQEDVRVATDDFDRFFAGRGVVIHPAP
jgi:hypothetical protein